MLSAKITVLILLAFFIVFHQTDAWRRRRRRRCPPRDCEVSSWSSWSWCSADQCGQQGSQRRTRTVVSSSSCGGAGCPALDQTRQCFGSKAVNCQLSSWSEWSACTTPCGVSGIQSTARHRVITEQCGGICTSTFRKTRACLELSCLNGGSLKGGTCFCKRGYSGDCCEKGNYYNMIKLKHQYKLTNCSVVASRCMGSVFSENLSDPTASRGIQRRSLQN